MTGPARAIAPQAAPRGDQLGMYRVRSIIDRFVVRRQVREHARAVGFSRLGCEELVVVASELCTNIVKYGVQGTLAVERLEDPRRGTGLLLCAEDCGPPFFDFGRAIEDGSDDHGEIPPESLYGRRGIAAGLGAVQRFSHFLWHEPFEGGKRVCAARYVR
jgi:anti-sigma regulatory factor (Ser/Thr protein kinase)